MKIWGEMGTNIKMGNTQQILKVKFLSENATMPSRANKDDAGYDLYSAYDITIPPNQLILVKTDIAIDLPKKTYGRVAPRSSMSKQKLFSQAGVVDKGYRGNISVMLLNLRDEEYKIEKGHRIGQLICEKISMPKIKRVETLSKTERQGNGFGSSGK
jgi:dUTP pyrophosphatase